MPCPLGQFADTCADKCWQREFGGRKEPAGYRADCPRCGAHRGLEWDAKPYAKTVRWRIFCSCDKEQVKPVLRARLGACMPGRQARQAIDPAELVKLALAEMPPTSLRLAMLEMAGLSTSEALDQLGVRREHRSRVISGRAPILVQNRRS